MVLTVLGSKGETSKHLAVRQQTGVKSEIFANFLFLTPKGHHTLLWAGTGPCLPLRGEGFMEEQSNDL